MPGVEPQIPTLSLVIPTYNQRERTRRAVSEAAAFLAGLAGERPELIVVDDASRAGQALEEADLPHGVVLIRHSRNLGKGGAVQSGVLRSRGEYVIFTDSDLPFSLAPVPVTLAWLRDGADVVIGDRLHPESQSATPVTPLRRLSSAVFTLLVQRAVGLDLADTQCGYKGYRGEVARNLFARLETASFAFDVEILKRVARAGYTLRRQPLRLVHNDDSSVSLVRHAPGICLDTLRIAWRAARGRYG